MKDVDFSEIAEEIIRDEATEIVDKAIPSKCCNFTRNDLIRLWNYGVEHGIEGYKK